VFTDDDIDFSAYCFEIDCHECPYFLRFDICSPEYSTNLWSEV
jgi:hypothetical protein